MAKIGVNYGLVTFPKDDRIIDVTLEIHDQIETEISGVIT